MISGTLRKVGSFLPRQLKDVLSPALPLVKELEDGTKYYIRKKKSDKMIETEYGFKMLIDTSDFAQRRHITEEGSAETFISELLNEKMSECDGDFIDVGANIGFYTLMFCKNSAGTAFVFEPLSYNIGKLKENLKLNDFSHRVVTFSHGLSITDCTSNLYFLPSNRGAAGNEFRDVPFYVDRQEERCEFMKLDNVQIRSDSISLIKIDVEGHEIDVLKGGRETIEKYKPDILIELHPTALKKQDQSVEELLSHLRGYGYSSIRTTDDRAQLGIEQAIQSSEKLTTNHAIFCEV